MRVGLPHCPSTIKRGRAKRGMRIFLADDAATEALGAKLAARARPGDILLLEGPLGAGKSTLARAFIRALAEDPKLTVPSPSFTLVQAYETPKGAEIWHYDLWRLDGPEGLAELGWDEAAAAQKIVLVEWPDRLGELAPPEALRLTLSHEGAGRGVELQGEGRWLDGL
jgi:tRNA threonylcarbamoyladenosine biosynthesis protein TsaE